MILVQWFWNRIFMPKILFDFRSTCSFPMWRISYQSQYWPCRMQQKPQCHSWFSLWLMMKCCNNRKRLYSNSTHSWYSWKILARLSTWEYFAIHWKAWVVINLYMSRYHASCSSILQWFRAGWEKPWWQWMNFNSKTKQQWCTDLRE